MSSVTAHCLFLREWFHRIRKSTARSGDRGERGWQ